MDAQIERLLNDFMFRYSDALTIGYLIALRGYDAPANMEGINEAEYAKGFELGAWDRKALAAAGGEPPTFIGYVPEGVMPLKMGQTITIPKGTVVHHRGTSERSKRDRKIKIHHFISGSNFHLNHAGELQKATTPKVCWPGSGGYWSEVDLNDIPEAVEAFRMAQRAQAEEARITGMEMLFEAIHQALVKDHNHPVDDDGFHSEIRADKAHVQMNMVTPDHMVIASLVVEPYFEARKMTVRTVITSSVCGDLPKSRTVFAALSWVMAAAESLDQKFIQPWNQVQ